MDTVELILSLPSAEHDRFIGWLESLARGFVEADAELRAYVPAEKWTSAKQEQLEARLAANGYSEALSIRVLGKKNWNALWEDTLSPVRAGPFVVCPSSVDAPPDATVLRIDPQMSFGTGHHATTRLALTLLATAVGTGDRVLDVGTGTGVLAIAACRRGAASALGVDTNPDAIRNARDNVAQNDVDTCVTIREGSVEIVPDATFEVVAANITRRVLLDLLPDLVSHLTGDGSLILSGVLARDRDSVVNAASSEGLHLDEEVTENGWWAGRFRPPL